MIETFALGYAAVFMTGLAFVITTPRNFGSVALFKILPFFGGLLCFALTLKRLGVI